MAKTIIHKDLKLYFGDEDYLEKSQNSSFSAMIFELLSERKPADTELGLFELILNLSVDHGSQTPSAVETIKAAGFGKTISESVAEGLLQINDVHGGAAELLMEEFYGVRQQLISCKQVVENYLKNGRKLPGFGHRIYKDVDPRAQVILDKVSNLEEGKDWVGLGKDLEQELNAQLGKKLPINIDGAIAVAFCALGLEPRLGKAVFIIARTPGLCGWYLNSMAKLK